VIFDVGARDSAFLDYQGDVHYFDPDPTGLESCRNNSNLRAYLNPFGLGEVNAEKTFYMSYFSFFDRPSLERPDIQKTFSIRRADEYMAELGIPAVNFLKIDTEGYELRVLQGFGDRLKDVVLAQFEYGGCWKDSGDKLADAVELLQRYGFTSFFAMPEYGTHVLRLLDFKDTYEYSNILCTR
jgi:FkbM family methyltransferase